MKWTTEQREIIERNRSIRTRNRAMKKIGPMLGKHYPEMPELPVPTNQKEIDREQR